MMMMDYQIMTIFVNVIADHCYYLGLKLGSSIAEAFKTFPKECFIHVCGDTECINQYFCKFYQEIHIKGNPPLSGVSREGLCEKL